MFGPWLRTALDKGVLLVVALVLTMLQALLWESALAQTASDPRTVAVIADLQSADPNKRIEAARIAAELPVKNKAVLDALAAALVQESISANKEALIAAIASFGRLAISHIWVLVKQLDQEDSISVAMQAISLIAQESPNPEELAYLVPSLLRGLDHKTPAIRQIAVFTFQKIGPAASAAVPNLVKALNTDQDPEVRWIILATLGVIGVSSREVTEAALLRLKDEDKGVRSAAAFFMRTLQLGSPAAAARTLVTELHDQPNEVMQRFVEAIGELKPEGVQVAIPLIRSGLRQNDPKIDRIAGIAALGFIGAAAAEAVPDLLHILATGSPNEKSMAARALPRISTSDQIVNALVRASQDGSRVAREGVAAALGSIGPIAASRTLPALIELAQDAIPEVKVEAAVALGKLGSSAGPALGVLTADLKGPERVRKAFARSIASIANSLRDAGEAASLRHLHASMEVMKPFADVKSDTETVRRAIEYLELTWWVQLSEGFARFYGQNAPYVWIGGVVLIWFASCGILFRYRPLVLLRLYELLKPLDISLPSWLGGGKVPLRTLSLIGFFAFHPRTSDAWVKSNLAMARKHFEGIASVSERDVFLDLPLVIGGRTFPSLNPQDIAPAFEGGVTVVSVIGEGGAGKTSLAAALGRFAMAETQDERLAKHVMIPIWIENEIVIQGDKDENALLEAIRRNLQLMIGAEELPSAHLVSRLLVQKRLMVIVDRLSELSEETKRIVQPARPTFVANCLVVTARGKPEFGDVRTTEIQPLRVAGNRISSFMEAYLMRRDKRLLFTDSEFFGACARLSEIVQGRTITVLFAKLFADEVIRQRESGSTVAQIRSLPFLIANYIGHINETVEDEPLEMEYVLKNLKIVAWKCIETRLAPSDATVTEVLSALGAEGKPFLDYLENRLKLIRRVEPDFDTIRFSLDPLAEYVGAAHFVDRVRGEEGLWDKTMEQLAGRSEAESIGFVRALYWYLHEAVEHEDRTLEPRLHQVVEMRERIERVLLEPKQRVAYSS